jgi:hypothetical protein
MTRKRIERRESSPILSLPFLPPSCPVPRLPPAGREVAGSTRMPPHPSTPAFVTVRCFLLDTGRLLE